MRTFMVRFPAMARCLAVFALAFASLHAPAATPDRERSYTADELLGAAMASVRDATRTGETGYADLGGPKSVENGLYMTGTYTYAYVGNSATLTVSTINNDSYTRTSGTLRLELWATTTRPARGAGLSGYKLATSSTLNPLPPRTYYSSVSRTTAFASPPDGTYWMVLVLAEYASSGCSSNGNYCVADSLVFSTQRTFGAPASTVTITSPSAGLCVQNVPIAAATSLQQSQPGVWNTYPVSTTCASLGMPFYAGDFPDYPELRVYTSSSSTALALCQAGLVVNCTAVPPPAANYSDLWWNPNESGWGISITQHSSGIAFIAWYTYDEFGNPKWYVATNCPVIGNGCTGALYETKGPPFGPSFDPSRVSVTQVGNITFSFASSSTGNMSYTIWGVPGVKAIVRQPF